MRAVNRQRGLLGSFNLFDFAVDGDGNLQFSYVELHDGREDLIYQCAATSPVLQGEYRSGDEFLLNVHKASTKPLASSSLAFQR